MALALSQDVEKMKFNPSRGLSRRKGNPKQESLVLNNTATLLNSRVCNLSEETNNQMIQDVSLWLPPHLLIQVNPSLTWTPHIRVSSTRNISPSKTALSSHASYTS